MGVGDDGQRSLAVGVADSDAEGVGGVGAGQAGQRQQARDHVLHLRLGGAAGADNGLFQLRRGVFGDFEFVRHQGADRGAAGLAQQQGGLRVDVDEDFFDCDWMVIVVRLLATIVLPIGAILAIWNEIGRASCRERV